MRDFSSYRNSGPQDGISAVPRTAGRMFSNGMRSTVRGRSGRDRSLRVPRCCEKVRGKDAGSRSLAHMPSRKTVRGGYAGWNYMSSK
jgi:hypothetical protein